MKTPLSTPSTEPIVYKSVILAGGISRRMGQDKALLSVDGQRLVDRVYTRLSSQCDDVFISGAKDYELGLKTLPDNPEGPRGPVGGIYTVWQTFRGQAIDGFITVPIDGPNLPLNFCQKMVGQRCAVSATTDGLHPTFAYWEMASLTHVFKTIGLNSSHALKSLASLCDARTVMLPDAKVFYNINTPDDLIHWEKTHEISQE